MFLGIDIGNSNIKLGLHDGHGWKQIFRIDTQISAETTYIRQEMEKFIQEHGLNSNELSRIVCSCVVPPIKPGVREVLNTLFDQTPLWVTPAIYPDLGVTLMKPDEIGTDLVANIVACHHLYHRNCIIVDFGTALTFTTLSKEGEVLGVAITPGLKTAVRALFTNTAQLPEVPLEYPQSVLGKDTIHAIRSGVLVGYVGLVRHHLAAIRKETGKDFMAIATGGLSKILDPLQDDFDVINKKLTLEGLKVIGDLVK